jgi:hypothetical protein
MGRSSICTSLASAVTSAVETVRQRLRLMPPVDDEAETELGGVGARRRERVMSGRAAARTGFGAEPLEKAFHLMALLDALNSRERRAPLR